MTKQNVPFVSFNRGIISPKSLARIDVDRTRLSAEVMRNFLAKTQGAMTIRPGTIHFGSSLRDTGAEWIEFIAATDDVALVELANDTGTGFGSMRIWLGDDPHDIALLERPPVETAVSLTDTGWADTSTGGSASTSVVDAIPVMTSATTSGVTIDASSEDAVQGNAGWKVGDNNNTTTWCDTGASVNILPSWVRFDFGAGNTEAIRSYSIRASSFSGQVDSAPNTWQLQGSANGSVWTTEDSRTSESGWSVSQKRSYTAQNDTGSTAYRYWRLNVTAHNGGSNDRLVIAEIELFPAIINSKSNFSAGALTLNATAIGALARVERHVVVDTGDLGVEHSLAVRIDRGPLTFRVGSTARDDDYISESSLGTGYHNLAFTPDTDFYITIQTDEIVDRIVGSLEIGDSGTVEITTPWTAADLDNVRYDQSADVVYTDCRGVHPYKIERRGTGRSWSAVKYLPNNGPFLPAPSSAAKLSVSQRYGNTTMNSDVPFFNEGHVGALVRAFHEGQSGRWPLGALGAATDAIQITGLSDTGGGNIQDERTLSVSASGAWSGRILIERSFDGEDRGFHPVPLNFFTTAVTSAGDSGTFSKTIKDTDDNIKAWYRARIADTGTGTAYSSGVAIVTITYRGGGVTGTGRITGYNSNTDVSFEVLSRFSDTGPSDNWQQGYWSTTHGFPTSVALHGGRLAHAEGGTMFLSVSDDYENFDDTTEGDAGPIIRTLGSGPVDNIYWLISLARLIMGTTGAEIQLKSSSLDEPVTPTNSAATTVSTRGSANLRAIKLDNKAIHVQRSGSRLFMIGLGASAQSFGDFEGVELTLLAPDLLAAGVVSIAVQRMPDTRLHCVLADGTVGILTYEPNEEVICWQKWTTDGVVERAMVLPGIAEDAVYYHIRRTINGRTRRFLEKWAKESECLGDTGLNWLADCASSYTDTGRTNTLADIAPHLAGANVVLWGDLDTGSTPFVDLSTDTGSDGSQRLYAVDTGGDITLSLTSGLHHAVAGLPYSAAWKSTKLAYGAQFGTALTQKKRVPQMGLVLYKTHNRGLYMGSDTGTDKIQPLPRTLDDDGVVDPDKVYPSLDEVPFAVPGGWKSDSRIALRAKAPRPCTVLAAVPQVDTNEK